LKERVAKACLTGEKVICLAVTEPSAGSDVANLKCEARKTPDGQHYIINGGSSSVEQQVHLPVANKPAINREEMDYKWCLC